jgi:hypothetical protein
MTPQASDIDFPRTNSARGRRVIGRRLLNWVLIPLAAIAVAVGAWAALAPVRSESREQVYVIPKGTWEHRQAGHHLDVIPSRIRLTLGVRDVLVMKNQDDVPQLFGPVLIMPGQSFQMPFQKPSEYIFTCPLHSSGLLTIVVEPMPEPGLARLRWRATGLVTPGAWL